MYSTSTTANQFMHLVSRVAMRDHLRRFGSIIHLVDTCIYAVTSRMRTNRRDCISHLIISPPIIRLWSLHQIGSALRSSRLALCARSSDQDPCPPSANVTADIKSPSPTSVQARILFAFVDPHKYPSPLFQLIMLLFSTGHFQD